MACLFSFVPAHMTSADGHECRGLQFATNQQDLQDGCNRVRVAFWREYSWVCVNERRMKRLLCSPLQPAVVNLCASRGRLEASRLDRSSHDLSQTTQKHFILFLCTFVIWPPRCLCVPALVAHHKNKTDTLHCPCKCFNKDFWLLRLMLPFVRVFSGLIGV